MTTNVAAVTCPTCSGPSRETVDMVCRTCLTDYAPGPRRWAEGYEAGRAEVTAAVEALADEWDRWAVSATRRGYPSPDDAMTFAQEKHARDLRNTLATFRADAGRDALNAAADAITALAGKACGGCDSCFGGHRDGLMAAAVIVRFRAEAVGDDHA